MSTTEAPEKPTRKFPPPCWTKEEALALIEAYRDRWYALRRGYLRTADWEAVAGAVAGRCPGSSPAKTSAQCRHKMEKLRQRYRVEKQRSLSFPGKFFSSWFFFDNMDSMENGPGCNPNAEIRVGSVGGIRIRTLCSRDSIEPVLGTKNCKVDVNSNSNLDPDQNGVGFRAKKCGKIEEISSPNFGSRVLNGCSTYLDDDESDEDCEDDTGFIHAFPVNSPIDRKLLKFGRIHGNFGPDSTHDEPGDDIDDEAEGSSYRKNPIDQVFITPEFSTKKFGYTNGGFCFKVPDGRYSVPTGCRVKSSGKAGGNSYNNLDSRFLNGSSSALGLGLMKKNSGRGIKREGDVIAEMVLAIRMLGDAFVKTEQMKMEMVREIEKMRIEMEVKRNELILQSQRQTMDAFMTLLTENKKRKTGTVDTLET
ncbi:hypothetical protein NMG60_11030214 [Bertholletia excelsa]